MCTEDHDKYFEKIFERLPCGIFLMKLDDDLTLQYANRYFYHLFGAEQEEEGEKRYRQLRLLVLAEDFVKLSGQIRDFVKRQQYSFDVTFRCLYGSGEIFWMTMRCVWLAEKPDSLIGVISDSGGQRGTNEQLRVSLEETRLAFQLTDKMMYTYYVKDRRLCLPQKAADEFGLPAVIQDVPYSIVEEDLIAAESRKAYIDFYEDMIKGKPNGQATVRKRRKDGSFGWFSAKFSLIRNWEGKPERGIIACEDISEQYEKELAYQKWCQYFASQKKNRIGCYEYNLTQNSFDEASSSEPPFSRYGNSYTETMTYIAEYLVTAEDRIMFSRFFDRERLLQRYKEGQCHMRLEYRWISVRGDKLWARATIQLLKEQYTSDVKLFIVIHDITDEKKHEEEIRCRLEEDMLTGVLNRVTFHDKVGEVLRKNEFYGQHALMILDIDHFKGINDSLGHQFGDLVLGDSAAILKRELRKDDLCGRIGGDEFMVFLNDVPSEKELEPRIAQICSSLTHCYEGYGTVSCSMGITFYPKDGIWFEELYQKADLALYEAKHSGRSCYKFYRVPFEQNGQNVC